MTITSIISTARRYHPFKGATVHNKYISFTNKEQKLKIVKATSGERER
jgi:hypothetical protein